MANGTGPSREVRIAAALSPYPASETEWKARYDRLFAAYIGEAYTAAESTAFHLFRVLDDGGNEIAQAKRLFQAFRHIVDTDVAGLLGGGLTLEVGDGESEGEGDDPRAALLISAEAVWNRSAVAERWEAWFTMAATMGGVGIEIMRRKSDRKAILVAHDPRTCCVYYDIESGTQIERVAIEFGHEDGDSVNDRDGVVEAGTRHTYRREIDAKEVRVYRDGVLTPGEGGPHLLGVPPFVWLPFKPAPDPEYGFSAAHGVEPALMRADSLMEEIGAVANRYGFPWIVARGFQLGAGSDVSKMGRILSGVPVDGGLEGATFGADAIEPLLKAIEGCLADIRQAPEFLFTDAAAGESGEARSYKAAAFEMKIGGVRNRWFPAIARATWYATLMDRRMAVDGDVADREVLKVEAGPILPRNVKTELEALDLAKSGIKAADYVRHLQRLGIVDGDEDPEAYAAEVADETAVRAEAMFVDPNAKPAPGDDAAP